MDHVIEDSSEPRVAVGLDFGTTFSGFAYAHKSEPEKVLLLYEWPDQASGGGKPYCKTQTSLLYDAHLKYQNWGWPAQVLYSQALQRSRLKRNNCLVGEEGVHVARSHANRVGHLITKFKLHLAVVYNCTGIWDDSAKQKMREYAQDAGMLLQSNSQGRSDGGSPHPLSIILEPEAAAVYCHYKLIDQLCLGKGEKFLTADIGGGTVDIVVHLKTNEGSRPQLKEITRSTGSLCGGTYVDRSFLIHLAKRIICLNSFLEENPTTTLFLLRWWEGVKSTFDGTSSVTLEVPSKLAKAWEAHDLSKKVDYDEIDLSVDDLKRIFDTVIQKIVKLIEDQLLQCNFGDVKAIMVVGGFAASPYLMRRLREEFSGVVKEVVSPPDPGSAVAQGAVMLGISQFDLITSRISRKTYGISTCQRFIAGVHPVSKQFWNDDGDLYCHDIFSVFVRKGNEVSANQSVARMFLPINQGQKSMSIFLFQSSEANPAYTSNEGVDKVGEIMVDISDGLDLDKARRVTVTMYFGWSSIQVFAQPANFGSGKKTYMLPIVFDNGTT